MDYFFLAIGCVGLAVAGKFCFHLLTDKDDFRESRDFDYVVVSIAACTHPNVGQYGGECRDCGDVFEIGGSE